MEIFCGEARLTKACAAVGLAACSIGWFKIGKYNGPNLQLDLTLPWAQSLVLDLIRCNRSSVIVWITPPSGTLSRARDRPLDQQWINAGVPSAPQLRSDNYLLGLPSALSSTALAAKIVSANALVKFTFKVIEACNARSLPWFVANPKNSYLWSFCEWQSHVFHDVDFALCAFGGPRPNPQRVRCSTVWIRPLARVCPQNHSHVSWQPSFLKGAFDGFSGKFSSRMPEKFAVDAANLVAKRVSACSAAPLGVAESLLLASSVASFSKDENKVRVARLAAASGWQARGRRLEQLVSEFKIEHSVVVAASECAHLSSRQRFDKPVKLGTTTFPKDTQVIKIVQGEGLHGTCTLHLGIPWSPVEFFGVAKGLRHPFAALSAPWEVANAVYLCVTLGPDEIAARRRAFLARWEGIAREIAPREKALVETLHPDVRPFAAKKRPLLLHRLLTEAGFPAADLLCRFIREGFPAFGPFPKTGVFPQRAHEATLAVEDLRKSAKWSRPALAGSFAGRSPDDASRELWKITLEERDRGECRGPFTADELGKRHPRGWAAASRFGVSQKGKLRPCDNYSLYGHNATSASEETVDTDGPDAIVNVGKLWSRAMASESFCLRTDDGSVWSGIRHPALSQKQAARLKARLIDLKRAYKQLCRTPEDEDFAIFGLLSPEGVLLYFEAIALGFGGRNAVLGFNLPARALRFILNTCLAVPVTHFYDDFTHVDAAAFSESSCETVERLFTLLGWDFKSDPEDLKPAASIFEPLGVRVDFSSPDVAIVSNTDRRVAKIAEEISRMTSLDVVPAADVHSIVGVCHFTEAQSSGRTGALALRAVRRAVLSRAEPARKLLRVALGDLADHVASAAPRRVTLAKQEPPVLVFTDAALERGSATLGAVLFDPSSLKFEFFAAAFAPCTVKAWQSEAPFGTNSAGPIKEQVICQAELAVVPVAIETWHATLAQREVFFFVDNDPAKDALVNGISRSMVSSELVKACRLRCAALGVAPWFDRVPSPSNIADDPSRGERAFLLKAGASEVCAVPPPGLSIVLDQLK